MGPLQSRNPVGLLACHQPRSLPHAPCLAGDLSDNREVAQKVADYYKAGGIVGAVCHGPVALANVFVDGMPIVAGKEVTAFTNAEEYEMKLATIVPFLLEDRLRERGAIFAPCDKWQPCVRI